MNIRALYHHLVPTSLRRKIDKWYKAALVVALCAAWFLFGLWVGKGE